uniref:Patched domain-containing protein 3 n=1 Tax=Romanomermis culicivorax TaxID=13658 RepID=A0A915JMF1_ROMCU
MQIGLELKNLVPYDSYVINNLKINDRYFSDYGTYATVIVNETVDFEDPITVNRLLDLYHFLCKTDHTDLGEFWLPDFLEFNKTLSTVVGYSFLATLDDFLNNPTYSKYANDFKFDDRHRGGLVISATKFYVRLKNVLSQNRVYVAKNLKEKFSKFGFAGFIYDPTFLLIDQQEATVQSVLQDILVTVAVMIAIILLFIPKFLCAFWIGLSIVSINVGVLGLLALWGVWLDIVSMLTSFMSVGLSVDYVAHVTYHYLAVKASSHEARLKRTMHHVALPAIQSATSAILGVSILGLVESYIVRTFVKTVVLVVVLGLAHGLLFLPVSLSFFVPVDQYIDSFASNYGRVKEYLATSLNFAPYFYQSSSSDRASNYFKTTPTPTDPTSPRSTENDEPQQPKLSEKELPDVPVADVPASNKRNIILGVDVERCRKKVPNNQSGGHLYDSPAESEYRSVEVACSTLEDHSIKCDGKDKTEDEDTVTTTILAVDLSSRSAMKNCMAIQEVMLSHKLSDC